MEEKKEKKVVNLDYASLYPRQQMMFDDLIMGEFLKKKKHKDRLEKMKKIMNNGQ